MTDTGILKLDDENFEEMTKSGVTLVDFYADWCGPCRMLTPVLEQVATELGSAAKVGKVDIDKSHKIAGNFQVASVPTMILFKDGKEFNRLVGLREATEIIDFIKAAI